MAVEYPATGNRRPPRSRGLTVALLACILIGVAVAGGYGCSVFELMTQAKVTLRGLQAYRQLAEKAAEGYDVREERARWLEACRAYGDRRFNRADAIVDDIYESLPAAEKVGERIYYRSTGGITVSGLLFRPVGEGPWPMIVVNHPGFGSAADFSDAGLVFRDRGYLVFCPDYRGSGESEGEHELAKGEVDDVINGIEYIKSKGLVDGDRVGLCGQSHGAAVAMIAAARYPAIKAVVEEAGFSDLVGAYEYHTDEKTGDPRVAKSLGEYFSVIGGTPEEVPQEYAVRSAINYVGEIQAPMLIIHGAKDPLVPVGQAEVMYRALRDAGKTVELKVYPDERHCVDGAERNEVWNLTFSWFDRYLKP